MDSSGCEHWLTTRPCEHFITSPICWINGEGRPVGWPSDLTSQHSHTSCCLQFRIEENYFCTLKMEAQLYVIHTVHVLIISVLSNNSSSWHDTLLHVSAPRHVCSITKCSCWIIYCWWKQQPPHNCQTFGWLHDVTNHNNVFFVGKTHN